MVPFSGIRRRRLLIGITILIAAYIFIKYLPTDVPSVAQRYDARTGLYQGRYIPGERHPEHHAQPVKDSSPSERQEDEVYDGPVKFDSLAVTLRSNMYSSSQEKDNVVFIIHDLKSASTLLSLACEMALKQRNVVHVAIMTAADPPVDAIMHVNGIAQLDCPIILHDARPDRIKESSPARRIAAVKSALGHIGGSLLPKVILSNIAYAEDPALFDAFQEKTRSLHIPMKLLLPGTSNQMRWITNLGALSLSHIDSIQIDILINASAESAGSLIRLLQSLCDASYAGLQIPRLTIELPSKDDPFIVQYLRNFKWPPNGNEMGTKLIVRRRIDPQRTNTAVAALQAFESFYPITSAASHLLLLSPNVELSPNYLHYLTYMLLEYKYSITKSSLHDRMLGISLELPLRNLDDNSPLWDENQTPEGPLALTQRPASNAALYFGDRWVDFHQFLTKRLLNDPTLSKSVEGNSKDVSSRHPSWLRFALEFMKARGLYMMYPAFAIDERFTLVKVYQSSLPVENKHESDNIHDERHRLHEHEEISEVESLQSLLDHMFNLSNSAGGFLPRDIDLPLYSSEGDLLMLGEFQAMTMEAGDQFSLALGGCSSLDDRQSRLYGSVDYLFCENG